MTDIPYRIALIVGAGSGISASFARGLAAAGLRVGLVARNAEKLTLLAAEIGAETFAVDAADPAAVARLFAEADNRLGEPDACSATAPPARMVRLPNSTRKPCTKQSKISAIGGFLTVQQAARRMIPHGRGAILLTGASASAKGYPHSPAFAMGKFALRGLAQSTARELGSKGIRVGHFVIDGGVRSARRPDLGGPSRQHARSRRDRTNVCRGAAATAQRLVSGGRAAALGRDLLTAGRI